MKLSDWTDSDEALAQLAAWRRDLAGLTATKDDKIQAAKESFARQAQPLVEGIGALERQLQAFVLEHQEELDGRSKKLTHGRVGFLLVHALHVRSGNKAIAWLVEAKKWAYVRVKHELNREALFDAPDDVKRAIGARVKATDEFWYEVDGERIAVKP